jgi:hypothetical protein
MFGERINVVWGASNSGKSYIVKALDFMSGAKTPLPPITEAQGYDKCRLELKLPVIGTVTLERSMKGGDFGLHIGSVNPASADRPDRTLSWDHRGKGESLSGFLLGELGVGAKEIARTLTGDKSAFTFRHHTDIDRLADRRIRTICRTNAQLFETGAGIRANLHAVFADAACKDQHSRSIPPIATAITTMCSATRAQNWATASFAFQTGRRLLRRLTYPPVARFEFGSGPNLNIKVGQRPQPSGFQTVNCITDGLLVRRR